MDFIVLNSDSLDFQLRPFCRTLRPSYDPVLISPSLAELLVQFRGPCWSEGSTSDCCPMAENTVSEFLYCRIIFPRGAVEISFFIYSCYLTSCLICNLLRLQKASFSRAPPGVSIISFYTTEPLLTLFEAANVEKLKNRNKQACWFKQPLSD